MTDHPRTQLQKVSRWIVNLRYEDIPAEVIHLAKLTLLDCISAICAGSRSSVGVNLKNALKASEHGGPYTLFPGGESWSLDNVLYYHSAMINALELDNFVFMGHIGQSSTSALLALGETKDVSGNELLTTYVASIEVAGRLSANLVSGPHQGHMRAFLHRVASATVVSKLLKYDEETTSRALAIALSMPEFPLYPACFSPDTKVICTSSPTVEGVRASFMAKEGMDGPLDIIENPAGFFTYFSYSDFIPDIWRWIGRTWTIHTLSVKNYATCAYAQGPVSSAMDLKRSYQFPADEIDKIDIYAPVVSVIMEKFSVPHFGASITPVNTHFSVIRSVAATLNFGELTGTFYEAGKFEERTDSISKLASRSHMFHDWQMTIDLLKGMDSGLENPGKPGFLSLKSSQKTFGRFKKAFGSRPLLRWKDLVEIPKVNLADQLYFLRRFLRSVSLLPGDRINDKNMDRAISHEGDLSKMIFNLSGRVRIFLKSGKQFESYCKLPPGFANDKERENIIRNKFFRETVPVWGLEKAKKAEVIIMSFNMYKCSDLMAVIKGE
jgi:2-methylcitrate dehydratase PrpD